MSDPQIVISDDATVSDSYTVSIQEVTPLAIGIQDDVIVTDAISIDPLIIDLLVTDNLILSDSVTVVMPGYVLQGDPDNASYVLFNDRRSFVEYRERRSLVPYRDKRATV